MPLTDLKTNPEHVLKHVAESGRPVLATSRGRGVAVVQSVAEFEAAEEARAFMRAVVEGLFDPDFVAIGNPALIQRRMQRRVPVGPGETLDCYVPFYFTPCSMMLYNLRTGWNGMTRRTPSELVFLVASLRSLQARGVPFVFTDRHAFMFLATFWTSIGDLEHLAWTHWRQRDFRRDPDDPEKTERYQAEALVHRHLPVDHIDAIVCGNRDAAARVGKMVRDRDRETEVACRRSWFF